MVRKNRNKRKKRHTHVLTNAVFNNINKLIDIDTKIKANDIINSINTKIIDIVYLIDTT